MNRLTANVADLAADYKARGFDRQACYSQFVKDRNLKPELDAKEFQTIFDFVTPCFLGEEIIAPTLSGERVEITSLDKDGKPYRVFIAYVTERGSNVYGGEYVQYKEANGHTGTVQTYPDGRWTRIREVK